MLAAIATCQTFQIPTAQVCMSNRVIMTVILLLFSAAQLGATMSILQCMPAYFWLQLQNWIYVLCVGAGVVCTGTPAACALPGAEGPHDEGGPNQGLHFPPRSPLLFQSGARQSCQVLSLSAASCPPPPSLLLAPCPLPPAPLLRPPPPPSPRLFLDCCLLP